MGKQIKQTEIKEVIRSVVREKIKEVTTNDWHYKAIMSIWDKGGSFTRKKIAAVLCGDPKADRRDVEAAIRNSGYDEVTDVTDRLRIEGIIKEEDSIPGGLAKGMTLNDIAEKHGVSVDILVAEFKKGIQTEMEHTTDKEVAKEITMDHLFEDPQYYTKLSSVEEYVDDKGVEHVAAALPQTEEEPIKEEDSDETLKGLKEMAMGDLERIADYAKMILERMGSGQELDSWMYSQITLAVDQLNSVHDTMDGNDGIKESVNEDKVYIDYLNKQKGFKQDRIKFNSYEEAVKWAKANFEKFNPDMIKYESVNEENPGLWANIRAKKARGEKSSPKNSQAYKDAVKAGEEIKKNESVNEVTEPEVITQIKTIAKNHQHNVVVDPKSGKKMKVDAFSASAIATVYDALSGSNQEKFVSSGLLGMQQMAMKLLKR
jgi:hypothetical protein